MKKGQQEAKWKDTSARRKVPPKLPMANVPVAVSENKKARSKGYTDYSTDDRIKAAVEEWNRIKGQKHTPSRIVFVEMKKLNSHTFQKYAHSDLAKRCQIGTKCGRKPVVSEDSSEFLCQNTIRADHANDGVTPSTAINSLMRLEGGLTHEQASNYAHRIFKKKISRSVEEEASQGTEVYVREESMHCGTAILLVRELRKGIVISM